MKTVMTTIRIPEHLHRKVKDLGLSFTEIMISALEKEVAKVEAGDDDIPLSADQRVEAALTALNGDHDLARYIASAGRPHRKVVAHVNSRVEAEAGVILTTRQKEMVRSFLANQFQQIRREVDTRPPPLDEVTGKRLNNFAINTGYRARIQVNGKTPELLREVGEKFIRASGPVTPTSIESIIEHLKLKF